jgi:hypothetical protein
MLYTAWLRSKLLLFCALLVMATLAGLIGRATAPEKPRAEEEAVLKVMQESFDAMAARDSEAMRRTSLPEGRFFHVEEIEGAIRIGSFSNQEDAERLATLQEPWLERMWTPQVLIHKQIAVVWTPYDFYRDGRFSHCGVDAFTFVKTVEGWKITGGVYTIERTDCAPSPLGPPAM